MQFLFSNTPETFSNMERLKAHEALEVDGENVDEKNYIRTNIFPIIIEVIFIFIVLYCSERVLHIHKFFCFLFDISNIFLV